MVRQPGPICTRMLGDPSAKVIRTWPVGQRVCLRPSLVSFSLCTLRCTLPIRFLLFVLLSLFFSIVFLRNRFRFRASI